jgi:hypothetical protein
MPAQWCLILDSASLLSQCGEIRGYSYGYELPTIQPSIFWPSSQTRVFRLRGFRSILRLRRHGTSRANRLFD